MVPSFILEQHVDSHWHTDAGCEHIRGLDIGCGSNLIYPLLGASAFGWQFTAADIETCAIDNARNILQQNDALKQLITVRLCEQYKPSGRSEEWHRAASSNTADGHGSMDEASPCSESSQLSGPLMNAVQDSEVYDFCMCNPPFFSTINHAKQNGRTDFGGTTAEMSCEGGEETFTMAMVADSLRLRGRVHWYTTMFGKKSTFRTVRKYVKGLSAVSAVRSLELAPSQTARWLLAWSFRVPWEMSSKPLQGLCRLSSDRSKK
jgi:23S rRNA (adenine1618-N6)-methyltransferase